MVAFNVGMVLISLGEYAPCLKPAPRGVLDLLEVLIVMSPFLVLSIAVYAKVLFFVLSGDFDKLGALFPATIFGCLVGVVDVLAAYFQCNKLIGCGQACD